MAWRWSLGQVGEGRAHALADDHRRRRFGHVRRRGDPAELVALLPGAGRGLASDAVDGPPVGDHARATLARVPRTGS